MTHTSIPQSQVNYTNQDLKWQKITRSRNFPDCSVVSTHYSQLCLLRNKISSTFSQYFSATKMQGQAPTRTARILFSNKLTAKTASVFSVLSFRLHSFLRCSFRLMRGIFTLLPAYLRLQIFIVFFAKFSLFFLFQPLAASAYY